MHYRLFVALALFGVTAAAGKLPLGDDLQGDSPAKSSASTSLASLKEEKRFGLGLSGGGLLSVMGAEIDVNVTPEVSFSMGLGTGLDYSTFMMKTRLFLPGAWVSPYLMAGVARWWTNGTNEKNVGPSVLRNKFLEGDNDHSDGFNVWLFSPGLGVQFMHPLGFAFFAEVQYLFRLFSLANGTYAGAGMHWYF